MKIDQIKNGNELTLSLDGRLDTSTAPELENIVNSSLDGVTSLTIDIERLNYISSAGLRVLLIAQKTMSKQGKMKITNVSELIMEIFELTGFIDILAVE